MSGDKRCARVRARNQTHFPETTVESAVLYLRLEQAGAFLLSWSRHGRISAAGARPSPRRAILKSKAGDKLSPCMSRTCVFPRWRLISSPSHLTTLQGSNVLHTIAAPNRIARAKLKRKRSTSPTSPTCPNSHCRPDWRHEQSLHHDAHRYRNFGKAAPNTEWWFDDYNITQNRRGE